MSHLAGAIAGMTSHSTPLASAIPCCACRYFDGMTAQATAALCRRPGCCRVRSSPINGCSAWERGPGADDELEVVPINLVLSAMC